MYKLQTPNYSNLDSDQDGNWTSVVDTQITAYSNVNSNPTSSWNAVDSSQSPNYDEIAA